MGGAPAGYDAGAYGRDFKRFHAFASAAAPEMLILGPGSVGETAGEPDAGDAGRIDPENARPADGIAARRGRCILLSPLGALSRRCAATGARRPRPMPRFSEEWLRRTDRTLAFYRTLRDVFAPGKPIVWLDRKPRMPHAAAIIGAHVPRQLRYLDQLRRLAKEGVEVVAHDALVASDYSLLDDVTLAPKPNYWGALMWRTLMGCPGARIRRPNPRAGSRLCPLFAGAWRVALLAINEAEASRATAGVPIPPALHAVGGRPARRGRATGMASSSARRH